MPKISTLNTTWCNKRIIQETISSLGIELGELHSLVVVPESNWMSPILHYLQENELTLDKGEAGRIRKQFAKYTLLSGKLYKTSRAYPMLWCLGEHEIARVLAEVHKEAYNSQTIKKAFIYKLLRLGYYWPTLMKDIISFFKKCDQCQ